LGKNSVAKSGNFFQRPNVIADTSSHGGRYAQSLVNPSEVVVQEVQLYGMLKVL
jgi:hypothetical protein